MEQAQSVPSGNWFSRNWKWLVPVLIVTPLLTCVCCAGIPISLAFGMIKSSEPYQHSLEAAQTNVELQDAIGTPIEAGFLVTGSVNLSGGSGNADLSYSVTGPDDSAAIYVVAQKQAGQWTYSRLEAVVTSDGASIPLQ